MNRLQKLKLIKGAIDDVFLRNRGALLALRGEDVIDGVYSKSDLAYICISTTAKAIAQVPLVIEAKQKDGTWELDPNNEWYERIERPNPLMDSFKFTESLVSYLLIGGNVWGIGLPTNYRFVPDSIWVIGRDSIKPKKDSASGQLAGWAYKPKKGTNINLTPEEVCHAWLFNDKDPIMGLAPHEAGKIEITTDYNAAKYNQLFFKQGASAVGVFSTDKTLNPAQYKMLHDEIRSRNSGLRNAHKDILLMKGLKYEPISSSHKDMDFMVGRGFSEKRVLQIYGMKNSIVSVTDDLNKATAEVDERNWWRSTNLPIMRLLESALTFTFMGFETGKRFRFDRTSVDALQHDFNELLGQAEKLKKLGYDVNTINTRLSLGMPEKPWLNFAYQPMSMNPIGDNGLPIIEDFVPEDNSGQQEETFITAYEPKQLPAPKRNDIWEVRYTGIWKLIVRDSDPISKTFDSRTRQSFYRMRQSVLAWLKDKNKNFIIDLIDSLDKDAFVLTRPLTELGEILVPHTEQLRSRVKALYEQSLTRGISTIIAETGMVFDIDILTLPESIYFLTNKTTKIKGITFTVEKQLLESLSNGLEAGEDLNDLTNRVRRVFNVANSRAKTIARTEVFGSVNKGRNIVINQIGRGFRKWFTALDEETREPHVYMHEEEVPVGEPWIVGGESLEHPGDPSGSAENIINCRCIETYKLKGE